MFIDGKSGAWNDAEVLNLIETNCFNQASAFEWDSNVDCTPFYSFANSIVAKTSDQIGA